LTGPQVASVPGVLTVLDRLSAPDVAAVRELVERATEADGVGPMSEHVLLHLPDGGDEGVRHVLARDGDGRLAGYAHLDVTDRVAGSSGEVVVEPGARGSGHGRALVEALLDASPDGRLRLWAHGDAGAAAALARSMGFRRSRVLLQMRRRLDAPLPEVVLPDGVVVRTFVPGRDEDAWLALNARAFADHPEQGRWTRTELDLRLGESWFDPAGFFLAEREGRLAGFHWTKVHGGSGPGHAHAPVGEVYVVGVDPAEQGRGLGPALTLLGLRSLQERGLAEVLLYVDESNGPAVRTYERLGFRTSAVDVCYAR
jgi:mycothiol synthase